jgi:hypothetical protein
MKNTLLLAALIGLTTLSVNAQTPKSGITNFSVDGHQRSMNLSADNEPDLYFIGENSTTLNEGVLVSDEMLKYTETKMKEFLGYDLVKTGVKRPAAIPTHMMGKLWVMETITDKKAFTQLNYDEAIEVQCRIGSAGQSGKSYKAFIEVSVKVTGKDGKTTFKKREKVKIAEKIQASLIEVQDGGSGLSIDFSNKGAEEAQGITAMQLLDWYKQALDNVLMR